jgi:hypothetical protein
MRRSGYSQIGQSLIPVRFSSEASLGPPSGHAAMGSRSGRSAIRAKSTKDPRSVRPTAAVRCAKVRSASRPAGHSESGWSDKVSVDVERTRVTLTPGRDFGKATNSQPPRSARRGRSASGDLQRKNHARERSSWVDRFPISIPDLGSKLIAVRYRPSAPEPRSPNPGRRAARRAPLPGSTTSPASRRTLPGATELDRPCSSSPHWRCPLPVRHAVCKLGACLHVEFAERFAEVVLDSWGSSAAAPLLRARRRSGRARCVGARSPIARA